MRKGVGGLWSGRSTRWLGHSERRTGAVLVAVRRKRSDFRSTTPSLKQGLDLHWGLLSKALSEVHAFSPMNLIAPASSPRKSTCRGMASQCTPKILHFIVVRRKMGLGCRGSKG